MVEGPWGLGAQAMVMVMVLVSPVSTSVTHTGGRATTPGLPTLPLPVLAPVPVLVLVPAPVFWLVGEALGAFPGLGPGPATTTLPGVPALPPWDCCSLEPFPGAPLAAWGSPCAPNLIVPVPNLAWGGTFPCSCAPAPGVPVAALELPDTGPVPAWLPLARLVPWDHFPRKLALEASLGGTTGVPPLIVVCRKGAEGAPLRPGAPARLCFLGGP